MKTNCEYLPEMYWHLEPVKPPRHTQAPLSGSQNPWLSQSQKNSQLGPYFPCLHTEEQTNLITFFSDCLVIIHVLKLSIFLKATNIKSDGIKFSREKGWGAIEYKKKNWYKIFVIMIQEEFFTRDTNYSCNWPPSVQQGRSTPLSHDHSGRSHTDTPLYTEIHRTLVNTLKFKSLIIVTKSSGTCTLCRYIQSSTVL